MNSLPQRAQTPRSPQTAPPLTLPSPRPISTCREKEVTPRQRAAVRAGADPLRAPAPQRAAPRPGRGPPSRGRAGKGGFTPAGPPSRQPSRRGTTRFGPPPPSLAARCFTLHPSPFTRRRHRAPRPRPARMRPPLVSAATGSPQPPFCLRALRVIWRRALASARGLSPPQPPFRLRALRARAFPPPAAPWEL